MRELVEDTGEADPEGDLVMPSTEKSAFLYLAGYPTASVLKNNVTCGSCRQATVDKQNTDEAVKFTVSKCYKDGALTVPSKGLTALLLVSEAVFRRNEDILHKHTNCTDVLVDKMTKATEHVGFPDCHPIKMHLLRRFTMLRIRIYLKEVSRCEHQKQKKALESRKFPSSSTARK
ncbi:unnamed protein product [Ixodes persulcatus]